MLAFHSHLKTWSDLVDTYIVFSDFYRQVFVGAGFSTTKISVKPHFVAPDPGPTKGPQSYALFVGRLAPEKGVGTLLDAWKRLKSIPLKIRGEGPLLRRIEQLDSSYNMELVPRLSKTELLALFRGARFLVWPSEGYYETFGLVAIEAFACGIPVIASRSGVMAEIVRHEVTGLHFTPGDRDDLAAKVHWAWTHPEQMAVMGYASRAEYETKYTPERNYEMLMQIYHRAVALKRSDTSVALNDALASREDRSLLSKGANQ
jgi:glycosyltransferase involved in cell wall biosynthesis